MTESGFDQVVQDWGIFWGRHILAGVQDNRAGAGEGREGGQVGQLGGEWVRVADHGSLSSAQNCHRSCLWPPSKPMS
jgi:hypothetical protein